MVILQNLRYSTFLAETMADLLHLIINNSPDALIFEEIFREIGNIEFEPDDKIAKEFSKFIVAVSATNPKETLRNMSMIQSQLDSDVGATVQEVIRNLFTCYK
jgi:predicted component of type VI protein secretion system